MLLRTGLALLSALALFASACGNAGGGSDDPRCTALCTIEQPAVANAGDVCSQASADSCVQLCGARIEGTTAACGDCLLQNADFSGTSGSSGNPCMSPSSKCPGASECSESGPGGTCTYCDNDAAAQQSCYVQANPRREVTCPTDFRDPAECSALCAVK